MLRHGCPRLGHALPGMTRGASSGNADARSRFGRGRKNGSCRRILGSQVLATKRDKGKKETGHSRLLSYTRVWSRPRHGGPEEVGLRQVERWAHLASNFLDPTNYLKA